MNVTRSVYDPARHSPEQRLRFAVAAVAISATEFVENPNSRKRFKQLQADVAERNAALEQQPKWTAS